MYFFVHELFYFMIGAIELSANQYFFSFNRLLNQGIIHKTRNAKVQIFDQPPLPCKGICTVFHRQNRVSQQNLGSSLKRYVFYGRSPVALNCFSPFLRILSQKFWPKTQVQQENLLKTLIAFPQNFKYIFSHDLK